MAVTPEQKAKTKLRKLIRARKSVIAQIEDLEKEKAELAEQIIEQLDIIGDTRFRPSKEEPGYILQRPETLVVNEEKLRAYLSKTAKDVIPQVFVTKTTTTFDKAAFHKAIDKGLIPNANKILEDEDYVKIVAQKPRLMPMQD